MISCQDALARLYEYLDGELAEVGADEVEEHLRICARCYPHLRLERSFREAVRRARECQEPAPAELRERIRGLIRDDAAGG